VEQVQAVGGTAAVLRLDISDVSSFASFTSELSEQLERWGTSRLDILVNNAGVGIFGPLEGVTTDDFDTVMGTNVRGTFFLTQSLVPLLAQGGQVINVSTSLTRHTSPATSVYSASKAAVEALSRTLAAELGPRGIRVNAIARGRPPPISTVERCGTTPRCARFWPDRPRSAASANLRRSATPSPRWPPRACAGSPPSA